MLFTNARLITPELADLFARVPPLKKIEISVYGMRPESYDAVACAPGAYAEFRRGVELLLERQVPFVVKSVLLPPNRAEIDDFEAWAATIPWMDRSRATRCSSTCGPAAIRSPRTGASRSCASPRGRPGLMARHEEAYRKATAQFAAGSCPAGDRLFACGAGETGCVDAYGMYQMCMLLRHPETVYDLKQGTLQEALNEFFPRSRETRATNPEYLERCARCFLKGLCEQCPAKSWTEHGTLDTPVEYLCQVAHAQARYLGLLNGGERAWEIADWRARIDTLVQEVKERRRASRAAISPAAGVTGERPREPGAPLLRLGAFIQSLAVVVMRPDDLVEFSRQSYKSGECDGLVRGALVDSGLTADELDLLASVPAKTGDLLLLGVGGGREAIPLARMGFRVTGVDYVARWSSEPEKMPPAAGSASMGWCRISQLDVPAGPMTSSGCPGRCTPACRRARGE